MIAFHGNPAIKAKYLARVAAHRAADELIQGTGWSSSRHRRRARCIGRAGSREQVRTLAALQVIQPTT